MRHKKICGFILDSERAGAILAALEEKFNAGSKTQAFEVEFPVERLSGEYQKGAFFWTNLIGVPKFRKFINKLELQLCLANQLEKE